MLNLSIASLAHRRPALTALLLCGTLLSCSGGGGGEAVSSETFVGASRDLLADVVPLEEKRASTRYGGFSFAVSPDEQWLIYFPRGDGSPGVRLSVVRIETGQVWSAMVEERAQNTHTDWFADCFSAASDRVLYGKRAAVLSADMSALIFEGPSGSLFDGASGPRGGARLGGVSLGVRFPMMNRKGTPVGDWFKLSGGFGKFAWSPDAAVRYEEDQQRERRQDLLRVFPPGALRGVDYSLVIAAFNESMIEFEGELEELTRAVSGEDIEVGALARASAEDTFIDLRYLSVSPDGKFLAAIAGLSLSARGFASRPMGVVIPLDRGGLVAHPFCEEVFGVLVWGEDSRSLYYYGQASREIVEIVEGRSIRRQVFHPEALPESFPEFPVDAE